MLYAAAAENCAMNAIHVKPPLSSAPPPAAPTITPTVSTSISGSEM